MTTHGAVAQADFDSEFQAWAELIAAEPERLLFLPVGGLTLHGRALVVGDVKFLHLSRPFLERLVQRVVTAADPSEAGTLQVRRGHAIEELKDFTDVSVALYRARATPFRVWEDGLANSKLALHRLRAYSMLTQAYPFGDHLALQGERGLHWQVGAALTSAGVDDLAARLATIDLRGGLDFFVHDLTEFRRLRLHLIPLAGPTKHQGTWDEVLRRSLHWIGMAQQQREPETAFLSLTVAFETLFTVGDHGMTAVIADGVALTTADSFEDRIKQAERMKVLYKFRSRVVHGQPHEVGWKEVDELRQVLRKVLLRVVEQGEQEVWTTKGDLDAFLKRLKYTN